MSFTRYPKYKDSGIEWLGEVPAHWDLTNLKRIVQSKRPITYGIVQAGPHIPDGVPYVRPADMSDEKGVRSPDEVLRTTAAIAEEYTRSTIRTGDLVCSIGPSFGKVMLTPGWLDGANLTQGTARIAVAAPNSSRFVFWVLRSGTASAQWESSIGGATFRALNLGPLSATVLVLPPPSEQTAIATFLDRETAKIDSLVTEQQQLIELLKEKRQTVISHTVTKGLNPDAPMKSSGIEWLSEVPAHWRVGPIKYFVLAKSGSIKTGPFGSQLTSADMQSGTIKVYNQRSVIDGDFESGENFISDEKFAELASFEAFPGDILVTTRGTIGRAAILPPDAERGILHPCLLRLQPDKALIEALFLKTLIQDSDLLKTQLGFLSNATTIEVIYSHTMASVVIPVPPLSEQIEIMEFLLGETAKLNNLITEAQRGIDLLEERRTALVSAAVTGKIDVRAIADRVAA